MVQRRLVAVTAAAVAAFIIAVSFLVFAPLSSGKDNSTPTLAELPSESKGIKISITGVDTSRTQATEAATTEVVQGESLNITAMVVNTNDTAFVINSFSQGFRVYDSFDNIVMSGDITQDMINAITLQKGESFPLVQPWDLKIISYSNSEPNFVDAPPGKYRLLISFSGGGIEISDSTTIDVLAKS